MHVATHDVRTSGCISTSDRNLSATVFSASGGHSVNQSIVQQLTKLGNCRRRPRNASPTGLKASTTCKLDWQRSTKNLYCSAGVFSWRFICLAAPRHFSARTAFSSDANRLGTSHVLSKLLMSSTNDSSLIWASVKRNTVDFPSPPAVVSSRFKSSRHSFLPYVLEISISTTVKSIMEEARRVQDWRPLPPTPTSSALPPGERKTRQILVMCSIMKRKSTSSIGFFETEL